MNQVSFETTPQERKFIGMIVERVGESCKREGLPFDKKSCQMDLAATHANGCPMDFGRLAEADDFNIAHDVFGIASHIDRETGKLTDFFRPHFALTTKEGE